MRGFGKYPWLVAPLVCCLPLALHLTGSDTPAEAYRVWLFHHFGFTIWNTQWYGGPHRTRVQRYFSAAGGLPGLWNGRSGRCTLTALLGNRLIRRETGRQHRLALLAFSAAVVENLVVGRMAFAVGLAFAVLALLQVSMRRPRRALVSATLTSLASPLAGFFLVLAALAWLRTKPSAVAGAGRGDGRGDRDPDVPRAGHVPVPLSTLIAVPPVAAMGWPMPFRDSQWPSARSLWI